MSQPIKLCVDQRVDITVPSLLPGEKGHKGTLWLTSMPGHGWLLVCLGKDTQMVFLEDPNLEKFPFPPEARLAYGSKERAEFAEATEASVQKAKDDLREKIEAHRKSCSDGPSTPLSGFHVGDPVDAAFDLAQGHPKAKRLAKKKKAKKKKGWLA